MSIVAHSAGHNLAVTYLLFISNTIERALRWKKDALVFQLGQVAGNSAASLFAQI